MKPKFTTTVYGRAAYEGFARAIGSKLGLHVQIDDGANACINSKGVIMLPGMNTFQTATEFEVTCGTIVHEMAHQFYGSHRLIDPNRDKLEHDCLNAVLDVADETWISEWFQRIGNGRPGDLLIQSCQNAVSTHRHAYWDWNNPDTHAWKVLCVGIFAARVPRMSRWKNYTACHASKHNVDARACFKLLRKARRSRTQNPHPTTKRFKKLFRLARELAVLLKPFAPPAGAPTPSAIDPIGAALAQGQASQPKGTRLATETEGERKADGPVAVKVAGRGSSNENATQEFDRSSFALLSPAANRIAQRIALDGDDLKRSDGLISGPCIGQAHRLMTDGMCLSRWSATDNADGVAVSILLDCSDSMRDRISECAGIARAFASAMRNAGPVQSLVFGDAVFESDDFSRVGDLGGTNTHLAIRRASAWLANKPGRKWIVVVTDGIPYDREQTNAAINEATAAGIRTLAIGLQCDLRMPAVCVTANDPAHLAIELDAAGRLIECGA